MIKKTIISNINKFILYTVITAAIWIINITVPFISGLYINYISSGLLDNIFAILICVIAIINIVQLGLKYLHSLITVKFNQGLAYQISNEVFQKLFRSKCSECKITDSAYTVDQINKDSHTIIQFVSSNIINLFFQITTFIISSSIIFKADKSLYAIIFLLIPFYILTFVLNQRKIYETRKVQKKMTNKYFSCYSEQIDRLYYVKCNTLGKEMEERLYNAFDIMLKSIIHSVNSNYLFSNLNQAVLVFAYICIIGISGYKVCTDDLSIGFFSIINTYFNMIITSVSYFIGLVGNFQDTKVSFERLQKIMRIEEEDFGSGFPDSIYMVEVKNFSLQYSSNHILLNHCDVTFRAGYIYGLCGPNGTGKTTLLNALIGLVSGHVSGSICYNGIKINQLDMPALRRQKISYVEQAPVMLNMSVGAYLHFGIEQNSTVFENQKRLLKVWDIDYLLDKEINENGSNFSGGEKQKLALVRALSKESSLILLDEPTAALDKPSVAKLIDLLQSMKSNAIIIVVSHDRDMLEHCDEVIELTSIQHFQVTP